MGTSAIRAGCERRADGTVVEVLGDQAAGPGARQRRLGDQRTGIFDHPAAPGATGVGGVVRADGEPGRPPAGLRDAVTRSPRVLDGSIGRLFPAATVACVDPSPMVEGVNQAQAADRGRARTGSASSGTAVLDGRGPRTDRFAERFL